MCFHVSGHNLSGLEVVCFLVSLSPDHVFPSGGFFQFCEFCESGPPIWQFTTSIQVSVIINIFSSITSSDVWVCLVTSKNFSGMGNDSSFGMYNLTLGCTWWRQMGKINFSPLIGVNTYFALSLSAWISDASVCSNSSMSATKMSPSPDSSACNAYPRNMPGKTLGPNWCSRGRSFAEIGWYSTTAPNGITVPLNGIPNRLSWRGCLLIKQKILNISQVATAFHGIRPPFILQ